MINIVIARKCYFFVLRLSDDKFMVSSEFFIWMNYFFDFCFVYCSICFHILDCPKAQTNSIRGEPPGPQLLPDYRRSVQFPPASSKYGSLCLQNDSHPGLHRLPSPHEWSTSCYRRYHPSNKSVFTVYKQQGPKVSSPICFSIAFNSNRKLFYKLYIYFFL